MKVGGDVTCGAQVTRPREMKCRSLMQYNGNAIEDVEIFIKFVEISEALSLGCKFYLKAIAYQRSLYCIYLLHLFTIFNMLKYLSYKNEQRNKINITKTIYS